MQNPVQHNRLSIDWPVPPDCNSQPVWNGSTFYVDGRHLPILTYEQGDSGWDDDLARLVAVESGRDKPIGQASRKHTLRQLHQWLPKTQVPHILEIGCSTGFMIEEIQCALPMAEIVGTDYSRPPLENLAERLPGIPFVQMDVSQCPLPDDVFDGIVILNVLEHIEDDDSAISHIYRMLKPGGIAILEVPAGPNLFDGFDAEAKHWRRYRMPALLNQLKRPGFEILAHSHLGFLVYPVFWLGKKKNRRLLDLTPEAQRQALLTTLKAGSNSNLLRTSFEIDAMLRKFVYFPTGIRCLVTCRKPL